MDRALARVRACSPSGASAPFSKPSQCATRGAASCGWTSPGSGISASTGLAAALQERGLEVATKDGELHVTGADAARVGMIAFEARVPVLGLAVKESSLEDAFLELTEEDAR